MGPVSAKGSKPTRWKSISCVLMVAMLFSAASAWTSGSTEVSGDVSGTWDLAGSPYIARDTIKVPSGQVLTIEPGVVVEFHDRGSCGGNYWFDIQGTLIAIGTVTDRITFTGITKDNCWEGISFSSGATSSVLEHCIIERFTQYGINMNSVYSFASNSVSIKNCIFRYGDAKNTPCGSGASMAIFSVFSNPEVINNLFHDLEFGVMLVFWPFAFARPVVSGNEFKDTWSAISLHSVTDAELTANTITNSFRAIYIDDSSPLIQENIVSFNTQGIFVYLSGDPLIQHNDFYGNSDFALKSFSGEALRAEDNWWGSKYGPEHTVELGAAGTIECEAPSEGGWNCDGCDTNQLPAGQLGDKVISHYTWKGVHYYTTVDYCPWLTSPWYIPPNAPPNAPTALKCEGEVNPGAVSDTTPEFKAIITDDDAGDTITHVEIQVGTDNDWGTAEMWDSGWVDVVDFTEGLESPDVTYGGRTLEALSEYWWRMRGKDDEGAEGTWSTEVAHFTVAGPSTAEVGNINGDGSIDVLDVRLCLQIVNGYLTPTAAQQAAADVDQDGDVDLDDATLLARYIIGMVDRLGNN